MIAVVDYGAGNLRSVDLALARLGAEAVITRDPDVMAGADGLIIEVHNDPAHAWCDGQQSITPEEFGHLMRRLGPVARAVGRAMPESGR